MKQVYSCQVTICKRMDALVLSYDTIAIYEPTYIHEAYHNFEVKDVRSKSIIVTFII